MSTNRLRKNAVSWLDMPSDHEYPVTVIKSGVVREESNEALWDHYHTVPRSHVPSWAATAFAVSLQALRTAAADPVDSLRYE